MLPTFEMSPKRARLEILRRISLGYTIAVIIQVGFTLVNLNLGSNIGLNLIILAVLASAAIGFYSAYKYKITRGAKKIHAQLKEWVELRYPLELTDKQIQKLATPSKVSVADIEGYCSEGVVIWHKDEFEKSNATTIRLLQANNEWIIFSPELNAEFPLNSQKKFEEEEEEFYAELWDEVREAGGFYSLASTETGGFISGVRDNTMIVLFWSDSLRAELWANAQAKEGLESVFVPLENFKEGVLKQVGNDRYLIGLNWAEKRRFFNPEYLQELITNS
jgi:hypothetical protein